MKEFKDKVAVVTGAAAGIGRAIAERSAREGMKVVLADIEEKALRKTARELKRSGADVLSVVTDVSDAGQVKRLADRTLKRFGAVHLVCNNAGVGMAMKPIWETELADWEWCFGANLWGVVHGIRTFVPIMLEQDTEGHVVNTASVAGLLPLPYVAIYHSTKHAVVTMTESLYYELLLMNSKVKASVLCPGFVRTQIMGCARNRPAKYGGELREEEIRVKSMWDAYHQAIDTGLPADYVADLVFHGLWREQLYILTTTEFNGELRKRAEDIVGQQSPMLNPALIEALGLRSEGAEEA